MVIRQTYVHSLMVFNGVHKAVPSSYGALSREDIMLRNKYRLDEEMHKSRCQMALSSMTFKWVALLCVTDTDGLHSGIQMCLLEPTSSPTATVIHLMMYCGTTVTCNGG